ncbi:MAG: threonine dehydratase [Acidimicrobiia bacterium]|nr:threonine dehydratase [Acidimicrobiia bacterium]
MHAPGLQDVLAARPRVYEHLAPTPLLRHPLLDGALGCAVWVKHENHNPTGSFKVRGGVNLVAQLGDAERRAGVVAASTGNHGQSIAFASRVHGVPCRIFVPVGANPEKIAGMRALGAEVIEFGRDFDEAREHVEDLAPREGWRYVHNANEPDLIAGVGTYALEIFDAVPDVDYVFVPIGGGSGAAACSVVRTARASRAKIVGVQAAGADAFARSWRGPARVTSDRIVTFAEGLATRVTFDLTFDILKKHLDDVVTLDEEELRWGVRTALGLTHNLAEGAGAASLAAAHQYGARIAGRTLVCVMSGGNIDAATLKAVLSC